MERFLLLCLHGCIDVIPPTEVVDLRLKNLEEGLRDEKTARHESVKDLTANKADQDDLKTLAEEVHGLRRALVLFSLTMIGTAVVFLVGVLAIVSQP